MSELRFYAACLASYNAGRLHGAWIDATNDVDTMREDVNAMLRASPCPNVVRQDWACPCGHAFSITLHGPADLDDRTYRPTCPECRDPLTSDDREGEPYQSAEEWAVHDYDGAWPSGFGEHSSLERIAAYAELIETAESRGIPAAVARDVLDNLGADDTDSAVEAIRDNFAGCYDSLGEWAEELESETGPLDSVPERLRPYIDFDAIGRDARLGGDIFDVRGEGGKLWIFWNR